MGREEWSLVPGEVGAALAMVGPLKRWVACGELLSHLLWVKWVKLVHAECCTPARDQGSKAVCTLYTPPQDGVLDVRWPLEVPGEFALWGARCFVEVNTTRHSLYRFVPSLFPCLPNSETRLHKRRVRFDT